MSSYRILFTLSMVKKKVISLVSSLYNRTDGQDTGVPINVKKYVIILHTVSVLPLLY